MAKNKGAEGKGDSKSVTERQKASQVTRGAILQERAVKAKVRKDQGEEFFAKKNADCFCGLTTFQSGKEGIHAFPGGDKPSLHLELRGETSIGQDGIEKRNLFVYVVAVQEGHPLCGLGLKFGVYLKAAWLKNPGFISTAINPAAASTQNKVSAYLVEQFGGPIEVSGAVKVIEKEESVQAGTPNLLTTGLKKQFDLVDEKTATNGNLHGVIKTSVGDSEMVIKLFRSVKYTGSDWGFTPSAIIRGNIELWGLHSQEKGTLFSLVHTDEDGYLILGMSHDKKKLHSVFSVIGEANKVPVKNGYIGGMSLPDLLNLKYKVGRLLGVEVFLTDKEKQLQGLVSASLKAKRLAEVAKARAEAEEKSKAEAQEKYRKLAEKREELLSRKPVTAYYVESGSPVTGVPVKGSEWRYLPNDTRVIEMSAGDVPEFISKVVAENGKLLLLGHKPATATPLEQDNKVEILETVIDEVGEGNFVEVHLVASTEVVRELRKQGLNGGTYMAFPEVVDGELTGFHQVVQVFHDRIDTVGVKLDRRDNRP